MAACQICSKSGQFGHNVSHSKRATPRRFLANVHKVKLVVAGRMRQMTVCTRCLRTYQRVTS
ncbi:MAG: 50S ribosomal protein L28 [Chloroflexi bacterium]|nr:50S ribosomal protein L28 [Chloroflexota bacterium]MBI4198596.1 50S ribosomal protein L28 [Chloroflexota bacterium]